MRRPLSLAQALPAMKNTLVRTTTQLMSPSAMTVPTQIYCPVQTAGSSSISCCRS